LANSLKNALVPNIVASELLGHSQASITYERYGKELDVRTKIEFLMKISVEDLKYIKPYAKLQLD
ncbi:hypothetical protein ACFL5R_01935, partial [Pseudomonadota bacterium]